MREINNWEKAAEDLPLICKDMTAPEDFLRRVLYLQNFQDWMRKICWIFCKKIKLMIWKII